MYLDHFSLQIKPFRITVDPQFLWLGEKHKEALATLRYGILDNRGFLLLTGEVGTGKTLLINRLISLLNIDTVIATVPDPDLESMDFYNLLADGLSLDRKFESKGEFLIQLRNFLYQSHAEQKQVLIIIDESQRLNHRLMEDIRVLSNIELHDRKLINIFFVGQQEFNSILLAPQNRALSQRITIRYHIEALNADEVGEYIHHRLKVAGSSKRIFDASAIAEVYQVSGGIPRLINIVCDHSMLTAYAQGAHHVDGKIITECAEELRIPVQKSKRDAASVKSVCSPSLSNDANKGGDGGKIASAVIAMKQPDTSKFDEPPGKKAYSSWRLAYAAIIIVLIGGIGLLVSDIKVGRAPRYAEENPTQQKYKSTLEREKAPLEDRLNIEAAASDKFASASKITTEPEQRDPGGAYKQLPPLKSKVTIPFTINSNTIDEHFYPVLDQIANHLTKNPELLVRVKGYTDNSGPSTYNESVSRFRASAVQSYLIGKGVDPRKIKVFAMGISNPIASNSTVAGRKRNRRVEVEFYNTSVSIQKW